MRRFPYFICRLLSKAGVRLFDWIKAKGAACAVFQTG